MRRSSSCGKALAIVAALALFATACSSERKATVFDEEPTGPVNFGPGDGKPGSDGGFKVPEASRKKIGFLDVLLEDQDGVGRAGVTIRYAGLPKQGKVMTGRGGRVRLELPPGNYTLSVRTGCVGRYEIFDGLEADFGIALGQTTKAPMVITMKPRYEYVGPSTWSPEVPWGPNETVEYRFSLFDGCRDDDAPDTSFDWMRYQPDAHLRLVGTPVLRSDGESFATVRFRCVASGEPKLWLVDRDTNDRVDVLAIRGPFTVDVDRCA